MYIAIDRFEGPLAICEKEDGSFVELERSCLPNGARAGSVLRLEAGEWVLDTQEEARRRAEIARLQEDLWQ